MQPIYGKHCIFSVNFFYGLRILRLFLEMCNANLYMYASCSKKDHPSILECTYAFCLRLSGPVVSVDHTLSNSTILHSCAVSPTFAQCEDSELFKKPHFSPCCSSQGFCLISHLFFVRQWNFRNNFSTASFLPFLYSIAPFVKLDPLCKFRLQFGMRQDHKYCLIQPNFRL